MDGFVIAAIQRINDLLMNEPPNSAPKGKKPIPNGYVDFSKMTTELWVLINNLYILGWKETDSILFDPSTLSKMVSQRFSGVTDIPGYLRTLPVNTKSLSSYAGSSRDLSIALLQNPPTGWVVFQQVKELNAEISKCIPSLQRFEKHIYIRPETIQKIAAEIRSMCDEQHHQDRADEAKDDVSRVDQVEKTPVASSSDNNPPETAPEPISSPKTAPKVSKRPLQQRPLVRKRQKPAEVVASDDKP